jgi:hypothetical protein
MGLVLVELAGSSFHRTVDTKELTSGATSDAQMQALQVQLGTPPPEATKRWTWWQAPDVPLQRMPWPAEVTTRLGYNGLALVDCMLAWDSGERPSVKRCLEHFWFRPTALDFGGAYDDDLLALRGFVPLSTPLLWAGERHPWHIRVGCMDLDTLRWLQEEVSAVAPGLDINFTEKGKRVNVKTEKGKKFILAGGLVPRPASSDMCKLSLLELFPLARVRAWLNAWREANRDLIADIAKEARAVAMSTVAHDEDLEIHLNNRIIPPAFWPAKPLSPELAKSIAKASWDDRGVGSGSGVWGPPVPDRGPARKSAGPKRAKLNLGSEGGASRIPLRPVSRPTTGVFARKRGEYRNHFLRFPASSWLLTACELAVAQADGEWAEDMHMDGGASCLHMGLTLHGERLLTCRQPGGREVLVWNRPGTVYFGQLTGPRHQVKHQPHASADLLQDKFSVSIMVRTTLFPHTQSRQKETTPAPQDFWRALVACFEKTVGRGAWRLPTLEECKLQLATQPSGGGSGSGPDGTGAGAAGAKRQRKR